MVMTSPAVLTPETPEAELVARAAAGDGAAFEILMRRHNQLLFRTARSYLRDDAEAEDALQDAYLRAWRALGSFRAESRLSTWLVAGGVGAAVAAGALVCWLRYRRLDAFR